MKIILGVTGCIGAYKSALILRLLQKEGFEVLPVMTRNAREFITPLTLEKLSGHPVVTELFGEHSASIEHISLARQSRLLLVAPATANILAKFAAGIADDFLSTLYLSTTTPVVAAPAMNAEMWRHPATQANLDLLKRRGVIVVEPAAGRLACGEEGPGRLAEPSDIVELVKRVLRPRRSLEGVKVLVTAGPTLEDIDAVRFISNRSSGKMGYAVAQEAVNRGAQVFLVSGPTFLQTPPGALLVKVRSAAEMADAVFNRFADSDVVVMAAAVSDFTPIQQTPYKIKKEEAELVIRMKQTADILKTLGERKTRQLLVGFAAESDEVVETARKKLREKHLDLIVANDISQPNRGFQSDSNQVVFIDPDGGADALPLLPKEEVASALCDRIETLLKGRPSHA
jgi:phosphopantothenoylcysteine decarboxylase/phosphopantothenate--cysteine ligase